MTVLSSSLVGGGLTQTHYILNLHVHKGYDQPDPAGDLLAFAQERGIPGVFVGMMTAANLDKTRLAVEQFQGLTVCTILSAGLSNACSAGISTPALYRPGTINVILLVNNRLSHAAMVNAVITATEAKCDCLRQLGRLTSNGEPATGTSTDTIAVAATERGKPLPYAGPATTVGWLIARAVRKSLDEALQ
jgi:iron complex transport system ATP-binding protein